MMPRTTLFRSLGLFFLLCAAPPAALAQGGGVVATPPPIEMDPVLIYDVTGGTLLGPIHLQLNVFSNGHASLAFGPGNVGDIGPSVQTAGVGPDEARALQIDLIRAGALRIEVPGSFCLDVPRTSVTVFRPMHRRVGKRRGHSRRFTRSHTYAYDCATGPHADAVFEVNGIIHDFIDRHFGN